MKPGLHTAGVLLVSLVLSADLWAQARGAGDGRVIYRYKNDQGVLVMDSKIPPEYVGRGYEVVSHSGTVLRVVEPSLKGEAAELAERERVARTEQARSDLQLRRSYSSVLDIDAAKERNLQNLRGNIGILEANQYSNRKRLQYTQEKAAAAERSGREAPAEVLKLIAELELEGRDIEAQIRQRETEYQQVSDKFDADRARFVEITREDLERGRAR